jgi:K+ transporter
MCDVPRLRSVQLRDAPRVLVKLKTRLTESLPNQASIHAPTLGSWFGRAASARSASDATDFFQIPTGRVVEIGMQVTF